MVSYKGLNFQTNNKYNYIEYKLSDSDLINENFITRLSLVSEYLLKYQTKHIFIHLLTRKKCDRINFWFVKYIILPQLTCSGDYFINLIVKSSYIQSLEEEFEDYPTIQFFEERTEAIQWLKNTEQINNKYKISL